MRTRVSMAALAVVAATAPVHGEFSNCALRNPDRQIFELFREATRYKTVTGWVGIDDRGRLERQLGDRLGVSELGRATMCIVFRGNVPIGFVHARAEVGQFGTIELVWALDLDLKVHDLSIQRSRERQTGVLRGREFRALVLGQDWRGLRKLHRGDPAGGTATLPRTAHHLAKLTARCGVLTALLLQSAFPAARNARLLGRTHGAFAKAEKATVVVDPLPTEVRASIEERVGRRVAMLDPEKLRVVRARDSEARTLGFAVETSAPNRDEVQLTWLVRADGEITAVAVDGELGIEHRADLASVRERDDTDEEGETVIGKLAREVRALVLALRGD